VTLDISLPELSGVRTYRELKSDPALRDIPVLMVTGAPKPFRGFISSRRQVPPPDGYLEKPVSADEYLSEVERLLGITTRESTEN
jgi:CheY-like chemotaxis protein